MQFSSTMGIAGALLGEHVERERIIAEVRENVADVNGFRPVPPTDDGEATAARATVCVDGAVISTQTDMLTWIAVAAATSDGSLQHQAAAATPVGSHVEQVRSAAMAAAELLVAVHVADQAGQVWMDGSLSTPLMAIASSVAAVSDEAAEAWASTLEDCHAIDLVCGYIELAHQGRVRALPKQDTSRVFTGQWAHDLADDKSAQWLRLQRDRTVVADLLPAGHYMTPRRAPEIAAFSVPEPRSAAMRGLHADLSDLLRWWEQITASVTYVMPHHLMRPIKVEFTTAADTHDPAVVAHEVAGLIDPLCRGPLMREPRPQWEVDHRAKQLVKVVDQLLQCEVEQTFGTRRPDTVRAYRT